MESAINTGVRKQMKTLPVLKWSTHSLAFLRPRAYDTRVEIV